MRKFWEGRDTRVLRSEKEYPGIGIWAVSMEKEEFGHMSCLLEEDAYFLYVKNGSMTCQINQKRENLYEGEGIFLNKKQAWRLLKSGEGCRFILVDFSLEFLEGIKKSIAESYIKEILLCRDFPYLKLTGKKKGQEEILKTILKMGTALEAKEKGEEMRLMGEVYIFWSCLYREFNSCSPVKAAGAKKETDKLQKMLSFLHDNYREKNTLAEMAAYSGVSTGEYCRFFKKHMEQTPVEYIQLCRIEKSIPELISRKGSIGEIAARFGFAGSSYYAETFKKEMGCAPGDYRKWYCRETDERCPLQEKTNVHKMQKKQTGQQNSMPAHLL